MRWSRMLTIVGAHAEAVGIEANGTMQLTVTRLVVRKALHGVHLTGRNRNFVLSDSHVYHNRGVGVFFDRVNLHQSNVTGSHVSYNGGGGIVVKAGEVRNLHVTGCDVEANHDKDGPPTANVLIDSTGGSNAEAAVTGCTIQHTRTAPGSANEPAAVNAEPSAAAPAPGSVTAGATFVTVTTRVSVETPPLPSSTVRVTVYVPSSA